MWFVPNEFLFLKMAPLAFSLVKAPAEGSRAIGKSYQPFRREIQSLRRRKLLGKGRKILEPFRKKKSGYPMI